MVEETMKLSRADLDCAFAVASEEKRNARPREAESPSGGAEAFLMASKRIIEIVRQIRAQPEGSNVLTEVQRRGYYWALYAVATNTTDSNERRLYSRRFLKACARMMELGAKMEVADRNSILKIAWFGAKRIWKQDVVGTELRELMVNALLLTKISLGEWDARNPDVRCVFLRGLIVRLCTLEKGEGEKRKSIPFEIAKMFLELCDQWLVFLQEEDFVRTPASPTEQQSKHRKVKDYPSVFEKAMSFANRCFKQYASANPKLLPSTQLITFARQHESRGKWILFYCGVWLSLIGRMEESRPYLVNALIENWESPWAWEYFAGTFRGQPEEQIKCLCNGVLCPRHNPEGDEGTVRKIHRKLAVLFQEKGQLTDAARERMLAQPNASCQEDLLFYQQHKKGVEALVCDGVQYLWVAGSLLIRNGKTFGFVRQKKDFIFVPPRIVAQYHLKDGSPVAGVAQKSLDKKKNREGWSLVRVMRE